MLRVVSKEDVGHAADGETIAGIVVDMRADMRTIAAQLNLSLPE